VHAVRNLVTVVVLSVAGALTGCTQAGTEAAGEGGAPAVGNYGPNMARCMADKGWPVTSTSEDSWETTTDIQASRQEQYEADAAACKAGFGYDRSPPPMSRAAAEAFNAKLVAAAECVRKLGYTTPDPPSTRAAVESLTSGGSPLWNPYEHVFDAVRSPAQLDDVFERCPQP
jgi:hypothetical protein